jgi:hypothetical protein
MKCTRSFFTAALLASSLTAFGAEKLPPGAIDFGTFTAPSSGAEFVEVNITSSLISLATKFIEKEDAEVAKLLNGLQSVRVNVIGLDDANRKAMADRVQKVKKQLNSNGWERIVTAQKENQDVGVYLKSANKDTVQGITVVVLDGDKEAVFINVVGDIRPEQLSKVGEKFNIDPLKKILPPAEHQ